MQLYVSDIASGNIKGRKISLVELEEITDGRGYLISIEFSNRVPFSVNRFSYVFNNKNQGRLAYACLRSKQLIICLSGKLRVKLHDGAEDCEYWLDTPSRALLLDPRVWLEMHDLSDDCALVVLASESYDADDYLYNFNNFIQEGKTNEKFSWQNNSSTSGRN